MAAAVAGAVVQAQAAGKEPVAGEILEDVGAAHAGHVQTAGHQVCPGVQVGLGVVDAAVEVPMMPEEACRSSFVVKGWRRTSSRLLVASGPKPARRFW